MVKDNERKQREMDNEKNKNSDNCCTVNSWTGEANTGTDLPDDVYIDPEVKRAQERFKAAEARAETRRNNAMLAAEAMRQSANDQFAYDTKENARELRQAIEAANRTARVRIAVEQLGELSADEARQLFEIAMNKLNGGSNDSNSTKFARASLWRWNRDKQMWTYESTRDVCGSGWR